MCRVVRDVAGVVAPDSSRGGHPDVLFATVVDAVIEIRASRSGSIEAERVTAAAAAAAAAVAADNQSSRE